MRIFIFFVCVTLSNVRCGEIRLTRDLGKLHQLVDACTCATGWARGNSWSGNPTYYPGGYERRSPYNGGGYDYPKPYYPSQRQPAYPALPAYPAYPSYPSQPPRCSVRCYPSQPSYPSYPSYPSFPGKGGGGIRPLPGSSNPSVIPASPAISTTSAQLPSGPSVIPAKPALKDLSLGPSDGNAGYHYDPPEIIINNA